MASLYVKDLKSYFLIYRIWFFRGVELNLKENSMFLRKKKSLKSRIMSKSNTLIYESKVHHWWITIFMLILLMLVVPATAEEDTESEKLRKTQSEFCGINCLYTILKMYGKEVDFNELVRPEYFEKKGSSLAHLRKAAEKYEMSAISVKRLSIKELRNCPWPVILHVKRKPGGRKYDHFILYVDSQNNKARVFDPPESPKLIPFHELSGLWDGLGLIVSNEPIRVNSVLMPAWRRFAVYASIAIMIILAIHWIKGRLFTPVATLPKKQLFGSYMMQSSGLVIVAVLCGFIYHFVSDKGLLGHANATASIQEAHVASFIPKVNSKKVEQLLHKKSTTFIDARYASDFEIEHLEGAINVPVDANDLELRKAIASIAKDTRIVVYCQSKNCSFAERVAIKLKTDGFSDISIFKGGWHEWELKNNDERI